MILNAFAQITGLSYKEVITVLKGYIYQNPDSWNECFYMGWETADEYLPGCVMDKLKKAKKANVQYNGYFSEGCGGELIQDNDKKHGWLIMCGKLLLFGEI